MSKISLRAYNQEIETLINRGQTDEAIGHCKYILKIFPKHIETYKLLGKAYLESQRYAEASDILARVLSVVPDDFVAQIGLSIIREDEGNLDAAIWHMERAYETQPSNSAIQEELRRLYGRRDGIEPHKIRLTRGALVRLYVKGDLYPQAVAEAKSALAEDPDRLDLSILLAKCHDQMGNKVEAVETSTRILKRLPNCYEANKIIASALTKPDEARVYQQRVNALDPYEGQLSPGMHNASEVPDNAVTLEQLEWQPSMDISIQPEWVSNMGIQLPEEQQATPDWATAIPEEAGIHPLGEILEDEIAQDEESPSTADFLTPPSVIPDETEAIPDWMSQAGWEISDSQSDESQMEPAGVSTAPEEENEAGEIPEIEAGIMPDWLKEISPPENELETDTAEDLEKLDLLDKILPASAAGIAAAASIAAADIEPKEETPDWLSDIVKGEKEEPSPASDFTTWEPARQPLEEEQGQEIQEGLDWLDRLADEHSSEQETILSSELDRMQNPPEWIKQAQPEEEAPTEGEETQIPDWLEESPPSAPVSADQETGSEEWPSLFLTESPAEQPAEAAETAAPISGVEETQVPESSTPFSAELFDEAASQVEWSSDAAEQPAADQPGQTEEEDSAFSWLESLAARQGADEATLVTSPEERETETPAWLSEFAEEIPETEAQAPADAISPLPVWMEEPADFGLTTEEEVEPAQEETTPEPGMEPLSEAHIVETPAEIGKPLDIDNDALSWLEALAAKHGADEGELVSDQSTRSEMPPEWIKELTETPEAAAPTAESAPEQEPESQLPDWIRELEAEEPTAQLAEEKITAPDVSEETIVEPNVEPEETEASAWASDILTTAPATEEVAQEGTAELPDWLSMEGEMPAEEASQDEDQSLEWLNTIIASEDQETPQDISDILSEEAIEETETLETEEQFLPSASTAESMPADELPDWLQQLDNEVGDEVVDFSMEFTESPATPDEETISLPETKPAETVQEFALPTSTLEETRQLMASGEIDTAVEQYAALIENGDHLDEVIEDLTEASYRHPLNAGVLQALGDAYASINRVKEALDAYTKAEELLLR
ncbi:MAG: tetratricopeptide repeat protein [Chloroflexi bacterium]|nr:tetratricopeptide repeat protein [Chloroflexota bacterium]